MSPDQTGGRSPSHILRVSDLNAKMGRDFLIEPDAAWRGQIAEELSILSLRKLRFEGRIIAEGTRDWRLEAHLGATVVQECVITLDPVTTRIEEEVIRRYLSELPEPETGEVEMPEDDTIEELPREIDLSGVMIEALSLALPPFPRKAEAELGEVVVTEPGAEPLRDADLKPFAGLRALRDKLGEDRSEDG